MTPASKSRLTLCADTAAELMTPNPVSIRANAGLQEARALFSQKGFSAAPVIDDSGRPLGVLSQTDLLIHDRESMEKTPKTSEFFQGMEKPVPNNSEAKESQARGNIQVRDLMTPATFSVKGHAPVDRVVADMIRLNVHRMFVVDESNVLVGVISALDIVKNLRSIP